MVSVFLSDLMSDVRKFDHLLSSSLFLSIDQSPSLPSNPLFGQSKDDYSTIYPFQLFTYRNKRSIEYRVDN